MNQPIAGRDLREPQRLCAIVVVIRSEQGRADARQKALYWGGREAGDSKFATKRIDHRTSTLIDGDPH